MRKFWMSVAIDLCLVAICVFLFKEKLADVLGELMWIYGIVAAIGIFLFFYVGWALTRAMNPKVNKNG
jgi:hypothetical protein